MSILICSKVHGGCGFIGHQDEFKSVPDDNVDLVICPECEEDHTSALTEENLGPLTDENSYERELGKKILNYDNITGKALCGCVHQAEDCVACEHDVAIARKHFWEELSS